MTMKRKTCPECCGDGEAVGAPVSETEIAICMRCKGRGSIPVKKQPPELTEPQLESIGAKLAEKLLLKKAREESKKWGVPVWRTDWGTKTNKGLAKMFFMLADEAQTTGNLTD